MPAGRTEITEIATALGTLSSSLVSALEHRPAQLVNVPDDVWEQLRELHESGDDADSFRTAFENGRAFLAAADGLRGRPPSRAEWKGRHRPPGDDVIPADLRIDHVFLISCKYLSKVLLNAGPPRLFDRLLVGEERSTVNWFAEAAPDEFQALYTAARSHTALPGLPLAVRDLVRDQQSELKEALNSRAWPHALQLPWSSLCDAVALESTRRWQLAMSSPRDKLRLLWRMLRITTATYFVLGTDRSAHLRLRIDSAWDWMQRYELRSFEVAARQAGQPEVGWQATVRRRSDSHDLTVTGHVEIRWSHGRFLGSPESKVYLDTPHNEVPGYNLLT
jgi:hypothetical protein